MKPVQVLGLTLIASIARGADPAQMPPTGGIEPALTAYHIGNSLTYGVASDPRFAGVMGTGSLGYTFGMHIRWGMPLAVIWDKQAEPSVAPAPFGAFPHALSAYAWQVVTLQPTFAIQEGPRGDIAMCARFLALIRQKSPDAQCYIYETWPTIGKNAAIGSFRAKWQRTYEPGRADGALYSHDYCRVLLDHLHADDPHAAKPLLLLPAGTVLAAVDARSRTGSAPALPGAEALYNADGVHLNAQGNYIVLCTWFAVLRHRSPVGLPGHEFVPAFTDAQARAIQELAWDIVQHDPACGVAPTPAASQAAPGHY